MKLQLDIPAPPFKLKDVFGRDIDLQNYSQKRLLVAFFRHAGCPFCNLRVHTLCKLHDTMKNPDFQMIFFFESKEQVILRSTFHKEVSPIPLISDPAKIWYGKYGLEESAYKSTVSHLTSFVQTAFKAKTAGVPMHLMADGESLNTMPAEFLLDRNLIVKKVLYSERLNDRLNVDEIRAFAESGKVLL
jgi:thioredoxin-dependent peroxiredoxin